MSRINLLPWREWERQRRQQEFVGQLAAVVLTAVLGVLAAGFFFNRLIDGQTERNDLLRTEIKVLDDKITEINDLKEKREQLLARMRVIQDLQGNRPVIVRVFDEMVRTLANGVHYQSVKLEGGNLAMNGVAEANNRVSALMRNLDGSPWFDNPNLKGIKENPDIGPQASTFDLNVRQVNPKRQSEDGEDSDEDEET